MPGRTPKEAVDAYIEPLRTAASCLKGFGKIMLAKPVKNVGDQSTWMLCGEDGMELPKFGSLYATQAFELVETDPQRFDISKGRFRVSTRMYLYKVRTPSYEVRWHWHPGGNSHEQRPHVHPSFNLEAHLPTARCVFEEIIEGCIRLGAEPACGDWEEKLLETGGIHKLYRTWVNHPAES